MTPQKTNTITNLRFAKDVLQGLSEQPKRLPSKYFYDAEGDRLFQEIMAMPEYYLTKAEFEILGTHKAALLERFGSMGFEETLERAAQLAEEGWGQSERRHADLVSQADKLREDPDSAEVFLLNNEVPPLYSIIRNPGLADALRLLQE